MKRSLRRWLLVLAALGTAGLVAIALGFFPQEPLRRRVERELRAAMGPGARLGSLRVVPGRLSAEARDVVLEGEAYRLEVPRAALSLDPSFLFGGPLTVASLALDSPRLALRPSTSAAPASAEPRIITVRVLQVQGGAVRYEDPALGTLTLTGVDALGSLGQGVLELQASGGALERGRGVPIRSLHARLDALPKLSGDMQAFAGGSRISASGSLGRIGALDPDLSVEGHVDLADASALGAAPMSGTLSYQGKIRGVGPTLRADARLSSQGVILAGWPIGELRGQVEHDAGGAGRTTFSLRAQFLAGRLAVQGRRDGQSARAELQLESADLDALRRSLDVESPALPGVLTGRVTADGNLSSSMRLEGEFDARHSGSDRELRAGAQASGLLSVADESLDLSWSATVEGQVPAFPRVQSLALSARGTAQGRLPPEVQGDLEGTVRLATEAGTQEIALQGDVRSRAHDADLDLRAQAAGGTATAVASVRDGRVENLTLTGQSLDLAMVLPAAKGRTGMRIDASGPVDRLTLSGRVELEELEWRGAKLGSVTAGLEGPQERVRWRLSAPDLALSGGGELISGRQRRVTGTLALAGLPLAPLAPLVAQDLDGTVAGNVDLNVPLDGGPAEARGRIESLEVRRDPWSARAAQPFTLTLRAGRINVDGLRVEGHGGTLEASGSLGLRRADPVDLRLAGDLDLAQIPWPGGWTLSGRTTLDAQLSRTLERPEVRGRIVAQDVAAEGPQLPPLTLANASVELEGTLARLSDTALSLAGGVVTLSGTLPFSLLAPDHRARTGDVARARVAWTGVQAAPLVARLRPGGQLTLEGSLAGEVEVQAASLSLAALHGRIELPQSSLQVREVPATLGPLAVEVRAGRFQTEALTLDTPGGRLTASGWIDLTGRRLDVAAQGALALRALSPFLEDASLAGTAEIDLHATGAFEALAPRGQVRIQDASVRLREIPQALTELGAKLAFDANSVRIEEGSAVFGGGNVTLAGGARLNGTSLSEIRLDMTGRDIALRYPVGLKSRVDANLSLTGRSGALLLSGSVNASRGLYDLDIALEESFRQAPRTPPESALLRSVGLDLRIETLQPARVKNNLADLEAGGTLTLRGDLQEPAPFGRLELQSGGKIFLQERSFAIESGQLEYAGTWDPSFNVSARAQIRGSDDLGRTNEYAVDIVVQGTLERPAIRFASQPVLSEPEIVSLIATGRTRDAALRSSAWVAGEQAAILLSGRVTRGVSRGLRRLGFDEVTIQPELLAREADPGARFTFGKQIGSTFGLLYSLSLNRPEDRFVQLDARPGLSTTGLVQRRDDGTWTYGGGQRFEWGGKRRGKAPKEERIRIREVRLLADEAVPSPQLREETRLRPGDRVTVWQLQDKADKLRSKLQKRGHLEAEVSGRFEGDVAILRVRAGARYAWQVEGMSDPPDLTSEIRKALFEEEAVELGRERLLSILRGRGHLRAEVEDRVVEDGQTRTLVFAVRAGPALRAQVEFPGAHELAPARLLQATGGAAELLASPEDAVRRIGEAYADRFHLAAQVGTPQVSEQEGTVVIRVPIEEGPRARLAGIVFEGTERAAEELAAVSGLEIGGPYDPERVAQAAMRVRDHYLGLGYPNVRVRGNARPEAPDLIGVFRVSEGQRVTVGGIEVVGATHTSESIVRRQVTLKPGDPLDPRKLAAIERRLLELGIFARATVVPSGENPTTLRVELQERARLHAGYDYRFNDVDKSTIQVDGEVANLVGHGLAIGGRLRVGRDVRETRGSLRLPALPGVGDLVGTVFQTEEDFRSIDPFTLEPLEATRVERGFQLQFARRLPDRWTLLYGYRLKRSSVRPTFGIPTDIAALESSLLRDTRDSPLDARRGRFWSLSAEYSPSWVGSDLTFVKGLGQVFVSRSINASWVWAQGYRLGLAHGFGGQQLIFSERFLAGGANTVRGYATESLGPRDVFGEPAGGQAVVLLNQELRFHHGSGFGVAGFYDAGNVFDSVSDLGFDLRHALGLGLRWDSPIGLLRIDVGFPLGREPGEKSHRIFFGLGQAF